eukprot:gene41255-57308_t
MRATLCALAFAALRIIPSHADVTIGIAEKDNGNGKGNAYEQVSGNGKETELTRWEEELRQVEKALRRRERCEAACAERRFRPPGAVGATHNYNSCYAQYCYES